MRNPFLFSLVLIFVMVSVSACGKRMPMPKGPTNVSSTVNLLPWNWFFLKTDDTVNEEIDMVVNLNESHFTIIGSNVQQTAPVIWESAGENALSAQIDLNGESFQVQVNEHQLILQSAGKKMIFLPAE